MASHERPSTHVPAEMEPDRFDASIFHGDLIQLLITKGDVSDLGDGHYYTFRIDDHEHPVIVASNYMTRLVHKSYEQPSNSAHDMTQALSLQNSEAVIDIQFPGDDRKVAYGCFRPVDIRPDRAYWLNLSPAELAELPQDHYIVVGPDGLVDVQSDAIMVFLAAWVTKEAEAA